MGRRKKSENHETEKKKQAEDPPKKDKTLKKVFRTIVRIICLPCRAIAKEISKRKKKAAEKKAAAQESEFECSSEYEKKVTFSETVTVHTYVPKRAQKIKISLKSLTNSHPPANLEIAKKVKGSSRETPLARKILEHLDQKVEDFEQIKKILKIRKKSTDKKPKSKIISILGKYTALSDSSDSQEQGHPSYKAEKTEKRKTKKTSKKKPVVSKKKQRPEYSDDLSSAASRAYDTMVRKARTKSPL